MKHLVWFFLAIFFFPFAAHAAGSASMYLDAVVYEVEQGDYFDVVVSVNPNGESIDTVRTVLTYDPTLLSSQDVSLSGVFERSAPGNYRDNAHGRVSWGAFTLESPVTEEASVVTVTFLALGQGGGSIQISGDSRAISGGDEKIDVSDLGEANVEISSKEGVESGAGVLMVESDTHQDEDSWYKEKEVSISWKNLEGSSEIRSYVYAFGLESDAIPEQTLSPDTTDLSLTVEDDGVYYFRLKGVQEDGVETGVSTFIVRVDSTEPNSIELTAQDTKVLEGESVWLTFATTDETSGVLQYQLSTNEGAFELVSNPLELTGLETGTYFFRVAALDRAGNTSYGGVSVRVYPEGTDLERPEGYEESGEVQSIKALASYFDATTEKNWLMLITFVLGGAVILGILYLVYKTKK